MKAIETDTHCRTDERHSSEHGDHESSLYCCHCEEEHTWSSRCLTEDFSDHDYAL